MAVILLLPFLAAAQPFTVQDIAFLGSKRDVITDWASRVVANGGAMPSQTSIIAMETLRVGLITAGLTNKIYSLCVFVPDSVIAATTPLIRHKGADPWTNNAFASTNLDVNGLKGDGSSKFLDTAIIAKIGVGANNVASSNFFITAIITESATNAANMPIVMNQQHIPGQGAIGLFASGAGASQVYSGVVQAGNAISTNDFVRVGFVSGGNDGTEVVLYVASPVESHKKLATATPSSAGFASASYDNSTFPVFAYRIQGTNSAFCAQRASLVCLHETFTQTESSNFWVLARACRASLGGGTGNPVHEWQTRLGDNLVSVNTSNALTTFRQGLDTDNLLYKIIVANPFVPDNLTAARQPILAQAGLLIWTNVLFDATNLTVNGLTGNGTSKYLGTGLNPAGITYGGFSSASAGLTTLRYLDTTNGSFELSGFGTSANSFFSMDDGVAAGAPTLRFSCFKVVNVNTNFLLRTKPASFGWVSGNRTASNAFAFYWVTNQVHNVGTNSTVLETSGTPTITNMFVFAAYNVNGTASGFSDKTISFVSIHPGHTQTDNSNYWYRVANLRTNLGGGVP